MTKLTKEIKKILEKGFDDAKAGKTYYEETVPALEALVEKEQKETIKEFLDDISEEMPVYEEPDYSEAKVQREVFEEQRYGK